MTSSTRNRLTVSTFFIASSVLGCSSSTISPPNRPLAEDAAILPSDVNGTGSTCSASTANAPGTYLFFNTAGRFTDNSYDIDPDANASQGLGGQNTWQADSLAPGTPPPVVPASQAPNSTPTPMNPTPAPTGSYYPVYYGTYSFGAPYPTTGCLTLVFEPGQTLYNTGDDAGAQGSPKTGVYSSSHQAASGTITKLSVIITGPANGNGKFSLDNGTSGTIAITGSQRLYR